PGLVAPHQDDAAVAAPLAVSLGLGRRRELDVQLHAAERFTRDDGAGARAGFEVAVTNGPFGVDELALAVVRPGRQVLSVEQHDGDRRRIAGSRARRYTRRLG